MKEDFFDKLKNACKKVKNLCATTWGKAICINVIVFVVLNAIAYATFQCDIDVMMRAVLSNVGVLFPTSHVGFSNTVLMKVLSVMMGVAPEIPWYTWMVEITAFIAITILGKLILENHSGKSHIIALAVFDLFVGYECYMFPSYIKSAVILGFASVMLVKYCYDRGAKNTYYIIPILLLVYTSMISITGFWFGVIGGIIITVIDVFLKRKFEKKLLIIALTLLCSILLSVVINIIDTQLYKSGDKDESKILEYRTDIEKLEVFGYPEYDEEKLEQYSIDEGPYSEMRYNGVYLVNDVNSEDMQLIHLLADEKIEFNGENLLRYFRTVPIRQIKVGYLYLFIIIAFLMMNSVTRHKKQMVISSIVILLISGMIAYFNYAWDNKTSQLIIYLPVLYWMLSNMKKIDGVSAKDIGVTLAILGVVLYGNFSDQIVTNVQDKAKIKEDIVASDLGNATLALDLNSFLRSYSAYAVYPDGLLYNIGSVVMNGHYCIYPSMHSYGYNNRVGELILWRDGGIMNADSYITIK